MVRFSKIIKVRAKKGDEAKPAERGIRKDRFRLSESQVFKAEDEHHEHEERPLGHQERLEIITYYEKFIERAMEVRERVQSDKGISPSPILSDLHYIIEKDLVDEMYTYAVSAQEDYDYVIIQTLDVTFTSLKVGKGMDYDLKMLLRLGLAAFLENVGMYKIPDSILRSTAELGREEVKLIKRHPEFSYEILGQLGEEYNWLAEVARQTHEKSDGSGYPLGLKGDKISEIASIVGLVDTYVAMIKNRPYREKIIQTEAIKAIVATGKNKFPPGVVKVFLDQISLFPVNSYIKLNNGAVGRVIATNESQPLRPAIELLYDKSEKRLESPQVINLSDNPLLYIEQSVKVPDA
jgi:HD-GYP domain-containing protein (c-di-GMP phosphodiesterase class II)